MSQHVFDTFHEGKLTRIFMGWDKSLQGYFLFIEKESDIDEPFWCNLTQGISHPKTVRPFLDVLKQLNIVIPSKMIEEIIQDGEANVGNKEVKHSIKNGQYSRLECSL